MPNLNCFLFVEPLKHYLNYASCLLSKTVQLNKQPSHVIAELKGENANPETINKTITNLQPTFISAVGHGAPDYFTVECKTPYLTSDSPVLSLMSSRILQLVSCLTGRELGPKTVEAGALAYAGYMEEFWYWIGTAPCFNRASVSPFLADFEGFTASLMRGETTGEARLNQLRRYEEEIDYWAFGDGKNHPYAAELARILEMNENASIFIGETSVSVATAAPTPTPTIITPPKPWKIPAIMALIASALLLTA
jgi:hypothetical protein